MFAQILKIEIMKNVILYSALMLLVFAGCNKDQRAVRILDGSWQLTKENGAPVEFGYSEQITFSNCKLKKDEYCTIKFDIADSGESFSFVGDYKVMDKGETLELRFTFFGESEIQRMKIKELTKSKLVLEQTEGSSIYTAEYNKI
jgi:hypothetical protein